MRELFQEQGNIIILVISLQAIQMQRIKSQNDESVRKRTQIQAHISIRNQKTINFMIPSKQNNSDDDSLEGSDDDQNEKKDTRFQTAQKKKFSDLLYKMIPKIIYKEVVLDSKREDYDMFVYKVNMKNSKDKDACYVISRAQLKKNQVPVDAKPIRCRDKAVYMAK